MIVLAGAALGAVFLTAGLAKLADREGSRQAVAAFGVPARFARPAAGLLPIAELATAISLFLVPDHTVGAIAAIALLVVFTAAIAIALIRGGRPTCYCFGQLESSPIGARTLVRNTALLGGAAYLWLGSAHTDDPSPAAWLFAPSAAVAAGSAALAAVSVIGFFLLQRRA